MKKVSNINCRYYTSFGECLHPELVIFPNTKPTCVLLHGISPCEYQTPTERPPAPPPHD